MLELTPVVRNLLILNVLIFVAQGLVPTLVPQGALYAFESPNFQPYQLISYMFLHGGGGHLFSNMLSLFFFGPSLERDVLGAQRFTLFYLLTGVGAAVLYLAINVYELSLIDDPNLLNIMLSIPTLGASGAVFGILAGYGLAFSEREIRLFLIPVPVKVKYAIIFFGLMEFYGGVYRTNTGIAHFAHLGGMAIGFILFKIWRISRFY
jgi:membrane associated rhomboid family serine protease